MKKIFQAFNQSFLNLTATLGEIPLLKPAAISMKPDRHYLSYNTQQTNKNFCKSYVLINLFV